MKKKLFKEVLNKDVEEIYDAEGCEECHDGYKGRLAIHEVLRINQQIRDALSNNKPKELIRDLVYGSGNVITMLQDGLEKVIKGYTTFEEILKLIELEDDDKTSSNSSLSEAIMETKEALSAREQASAEYMGVRPELANNQVNSPTLQSDNYNTLSEYTIDASQNAVTPPVNQVNNQTNDIESLDI